MEAPRYNAVSVYTGDRDDVYIEEDNSTQHEEDLSVLTGVKQKQDHKVEARYKVTFERHYGNLLPTSWILCYVSLRL